MPKYQNIEILKSLNPEQRQAVTTIKGPVLVLAGAGSGKTRVLTHRIAYLISSGVKPEQILALTFTNKAANEMRERVQKLLQAANHKLQPKNFPFIGTFHSLGAYILRTNSKNLGIPRHFSILDGEESLAVIKTALKELELNPAQFQPAKIQSFISQQKNELLNPADLVRDSKGNSEFFLKVCSQIWERYEEQLKKQQALDFDDLIAKTVLLFQSHPNVLNKYQNQWKYIHIDEYQDTNRSQYLMTNLLAKKHKNLCVVGDEDQSIYSFRGADFRNILSFEKDYPEAKVIALETNYRSAQTILDAANAVIAKNKLRKPKRLVGLKNKGGRITLFTAQNEIEEARFIALKTKEFLQAGVAPASIAVLYRTNFQSRVLEEEFLANSLPYQVLGVKFYERKEIKDILAYIKASLNPNDLLSIKRIINVPSRGIGKVLMTKYFAQILRYPAEAGSARQEKPLSAKERQRLQSFNQILKSIKEIVSKEPASKVIKFVIHKTGYQQFLQDNTEEGEMRLENIKELAALAKRYDSLSPPAGIEKLLEEAALMTEQDNLDINAQHRVLNTGKGAVRLMTVHAAKGLEFDYVFIAGLEEGLFPHAASAYQSDLIRQEEERRLFYVALTRAKESVFLSYALFRSIFGEKLINQPSRFLLDIPPELLETFEELPENNVQIDE